MDESTYMKLEQEQGKRKIPPPCDRACMGGLVTRSGMGMGCANKGLGSGFGGNVNINGSINNKGNGNGVGNGNGNWKVVIGMAVSYYFLLGRIQSGSGTSNSILMQRDVC